MTTPTPFAAWLREQMAARSFGGNQSKLAAEMGINPGTVNRWLTVGAIPKQPTLELLAKALHLPLAEVLRAAGAGLDDATGDAPEWLALVAMLSPGDQAIVELVVRRLARGS